MEQIVQLSNFALAVTNFLVASFLIVRGFGVSRDVGAGSVTAEAQKSYQDLLDSRHAIDSAADADRFFDRFWSIQVLHYEQWKRALIPDAVYFDWLMKRREQYHSNDSYADLSFKKAWSERYSQRYHLTKFGRFMNGILDFGPPHDASAEKTAAFIMSAMRSERKSRKLAI